MPDYRPVLLAFALAACASAPQPRTADQAAAPQPPVARKEPHVTRINGDTLRDDYFWLRNTWTLRATAAPPAATTASRTSPTTTPSWSASSLPRGDDQYLESSPVINPAISEPDCADIID